jgi:hypothetical protein
MNARRSNAALLAEYIAAFEKLDDLRDWNIPSVLLVSKDAYGQDQWQPRQITTPPAALESLYQGLGLAGHGSTRFPPLYETLLLSYRWAEVDLSDYRLIANEPAEDFAPLLAALRSDKHLLETLLPNGYIPFGKGPDVDYDPVCFDLRMRNKNGDCRIVKLEHEAILCGYRIRETAELAPSFRSLILNTIHRASTRQSAASTSAFP